MKIFVILYCIFLGILFEGNTKFLGVVGPSESEFYLDKTFSSVNPEYGSTVHAVLIYS